MTRRSSLAILLCSSFAFLGCNPGGTSGGGSTGTSSADQTKGTPLAHVGDQVITVQEFQKRLDRQAPFLRAQYNTPERKKAFLENMIRFDLLAQEAKRRGLENDPDVQETMKKVMVQKLIRKEFAENPAQQLPMDELHAYYQKHISDYVKPERVRVAHIFVAFKSGDKKSVAAAKKKAKAILAEVHAKEKDPRSFMLIAREKTEDAASRATGGDLRYLAKDELAKAWSPAVADAAFAMKNVGEVSGLVKGTKGFHILRLVGRQRALDRTFDQVRANVEARLRQEKRRERYDDFIAKLRKAAGVTIDQKLLDSIKATSAGIGRRGPMGMPMGHPAMPAMRGGHPAMPAGHPAMPHSMPVHPAPHPSAVHPAPHPAPAKAPAKGPGNAPAAGHGGK